MDNPFFNLAPRIRVLLVKRRTARDYWDVKTWMDVHENGEHPHMFVSLETKDSALFEGVHEATVAPIFVNQVLRFSLESLPEHCPPTLHMQHVFAQSLLFWMGLNERHHVIIVCDLCLHTVLILEFLLRALRLDQEETPFQLIQKTFPNFPVSQEQRDQKSCQVYDAHVDTIFRNAPRRYQSQIVYVKSITFNHLSGHLLQDLEIRIFQLGFRKKHIKKYPVADRKGYTVRSPDESTLKFVFLNRTTSLVDQAKPRLMCGDTWFELKKKSGGVLARWPMHTCFLGAKPEVMRWTLSDVDCPDETASAELGAQLEIEVMLGFFKRDDEKNRKACQSEQIKYCSRVLSKPESSANCFLSSHIVQPGQDIVRVLQRENGCKEKDACVSLSLACNNPLLATDILKRFFPTNRSPPWCGTTGRHLNPAQLRCVSGYTEECLIPPPARPVTRLTSMTGVPQPPDGLVATDEMENSVAAMDSPTFLPKSL